MRHAALRKWSPPALAAILFALLSLAILPYPGLQDDELLFTVPLYSPGGARFSMKIFGARIPLMLIGYLGTLKTWLYAGIFELLEPSRWSIRAPMVIVGVITISLTWVWTHRAAGPRAAIFTVALLSTDAAFIVTNTFDWGPVALQHALLMGGLVAIQSWLRQDQQSRRANWILALAFFLWGLGLWDKALMIWPLIGIAVATACVYPKELLRHARRVPLTIAIASLLLGALPLVCYNVARHGETLSTNTRIAIAQVPGKIDELQYTLNGSVLLGPLVSTSPGPLIKTPATTVERASVAIAQQLGDHASNWMLPALTLSLVCMIFLVRTRLLAFILIATAITWLQMASNTGTGGGAHHVILLWPFPCIFVGVAMAGAASRTRKPLSHAITALIALLLCGNLLNTNEYLADLIRNGGAHAWTDASYRLTGAVQHYRANQIGIVDWGYLNNLRMTYNGQLKMTTVNDLIRNPVMTDEDRKQLDAMIASPDSVFIQHTYEEQIFPGINDQLRAIARPLGYSEEILRTVHDNQARPIFEIFRFVKQP
jgi:hypothetical protein